MNTLRLSFLGLILSSIKKEAKGASIVWICWRPSYVFEKLMCYFSLWLGIRSLSEAKDWASFTSVFWNRYLLKMFKKKPILRMAIKPPRRARPTRKESGYFTFYTMIFFCNLKSRLTELMFLTVVFYCLELHESIKGPWYANIGFVNSFYHIVSYS